MQPRQLYLLFAVTGTVVPWLFFQSFFVQYGLNIPLFVASLFDNGAAGGFAADVLVSILVFIYWAWQDARANRVGRWWLIFPALFTVGLSLAFPLYLYLKSCKS